MKHKKHFIPLLAILLAVVMLFGLVDNIQPEEVQAASIADLEDEIADLESQNAEMEAEIKALRQQQQQNLEGMEALVAQKDLLDQEISLMYNQVLLMNNQIAAYSLLIADKQAELDDAQQELSQLQEKNKLRIRTMEENGSLSYWSVLAEANNLMDMLDRLEMVQEIAKSDEKCLQELSDAAQEVANAKDAMTAEQQALQEKRDALGVVEQELEAKRAETDQLLIEIKAQHDEYQAMIDNSEKMQEDLMQELANRKDELEDAKEQQKPVSGGSAPSSSGWMNPVNGYYVITSPFGYRIHPISGQWRLHSGIDMAGSLNTPILASRSGTVAVAAFQSGGAGWYVSINHGDGFKSIYMHMTRYIVSAGQYVEQGQVIGYMGTSGGSTGVHLHFGISYNGVYYNPLNYVSL